ncbi:MAG: hypothetical protein R3296_04260 [Oleiphilaceae bacterium]|nr:hypothetical protein [Oleiphilaceae bacterium]
MQHCPHCQNKLSLLERARLNHGTLYHCPACHKTSLPGDGYMALHWMLGGGVGALVAFVTPGLESLALGAGAGLLAGLFFLRFGSELYPASREPSGGY